MELNIVTAILDITCIVAGSLFLMFAGIVNNGFLRLILLIIGITLIRLMLILP